MFDHFCSFGPNCHSAQILKRNHWKQVSFPFDWGFSTPSIIIDCIETDFSYFIDTNYCVGDESKEGNTNIYYYPDPTINMLNHRNILRPDHKAYYERCIHRFQTVLKSTESKLFIFTFLDVKTYLDENMADKVHDVYNTTVEDILQFNTEFAKYTSNYRILCIFQSIGNERRYLWSKNKNVDFLELETVSKSGGNYFLDDHDNIFLDELLQKYVQNPKILFLYE